MSIKTTIKVDINEKDALDFPLYYKMKMVNPERAPMFTAIEELKDPESLKEFVLEYGRWLTKYGETKEVRDKGQEIALSNIGYGAGYYSEETRRRVYNTLGSIHPIFGRC